MKKQFLKVRLSVEQQRQLHPEWSEQDFSDYAAT